MVNDLEHIETTSQENDHGVTPEKKNSGTFAETIRFALISLLIVIPFRIFVAQPFVVSGASMDPAFENGEYLIVDQVSYRIHEPQRGDIVIFKYPRDLSKYFIKRVIGLPGETIEVVNGRVYITTPSSTEPTLLNEPYINEDNSPDHVKVTLTDREYFVMGDNREASSDSRVWGPLQRHLIIGTPFVRLFPLSRIDFKPGTPTN